ARGATRPTSPPRRSRCSTAADHSDRCAPGHDQLASPSWPTGPVPPRRDQEPEAMVAPPAASETVFRLIYRSRMRIASEARKSELGEIFSIARSNNKRLGVTG